LDKFYNKKEIPWVKLIWKVHYSNGQIPQERNPLGQTHLDGPCNTPETTNTPECY
jgi:hypothetical protein